MIFADGVSFRKSKTSSMVAMLSSIIELPPLLRASFQNIVTHFLICSSSPDLELFFKSNLDAFSNIFTNGVHLQNLGVTVKVKVIAIVADLIETPKLLNTMQFNANEGGCLQCFIRPEAIEISKIVTCLFFQVPIL